MTVAPEPQELPTDSEEAPQTDALPEELPPVEPPSAGFIVQLFVVPGFIVLAIVGVWALFGRMSASDQDWQSLVNEMRTTNKHRRWRGAYGLAQVLDIDANRGQDGQKLAANREIAQELCALTTEQLEKPGKTEDDLKQLAFLTRTLGMLDVTDLVLPELHKSMMEDQDREVRKNAIASVALIAGRAMEAGHPIEDQKIADQLVSVTTDSDAFVRQLSTYALGLIPSEQSQQRLKVLLEDGDPNTRMNAAIGLSRQKSTAGYDLFVSILKEALLNADAKGKSDERFQHLVSLKNSIKAIGDLAEEFTANQRAELLKLLTQLSDEHAEQRIRIDAQKAMALLNTVKE